MTKNVKDLPACIRFCVIEILTAYQETEPQDRTLDTAHEGFLFIHENFVQLEKHLFKLGAATSITRQRQAAAKLAASALRILTDFANDKECEPCQKKASKQSQPTKQSNS